jgi:type IV secretion system protein VirD4
MIIVDIKGELVRLSKVHRQDQFLNRCVVIDPFNISWHGGDSFNILDLIARDSPFLLDFCRAIGDALVVSTGREESPHWNEMAAQVLAFFTAYVASALPPEYRHLGTVRHIVCSRTRFVETIQLMKESNACGGKLRQAGEQLEWLIDRELASVMASVQRHTSWMDSPAVESVLTRSSFNPRELRDGKLSIYLVLPPDKLESHAALMRLWIDGLLRALMMDGADESSPVLALIDEAGHIGPIKSLQTAVTLGRGFGIRLFFVFQSLGQVQECYKNHAQTFIENIDTQIYFGTTAYATAEEISKRIGEYTLLVESRGSSSGYSHQRGREESTSFSSTSSVNTSEIGRRVFKPEEILTMGERAALVFHRNLSVIPVQLVRHYEDPAFRDGGTGDEHTRPVLARLARGMIAAAAALLFVVAVVWAALVLPTAGVVPQRPQQDAPGRMPHLGYGQPVPQPAGTPYGWPANTPSTPGGMGGPAGGMRFTPSRPGRWPVNSPSTIGGMGGPAGGMR